MKKFFYFMVALATFSASAQVGIGVPTANIDASAQLEVTSTNKGFLAPRMTETQKNAIATPAAGLLVYQTDGTSGFYYYDGAVWKSGLGPQGLNGEQGPAGTPADLSSYATTAALGQLETQVAQSTSDISALGSSLNEKAPIASPSFTGAVTVGGASSTASAVVEVSSTTQGFLPPRMTAAQRNAISSPVAGLVLWCTNCGTSGELQVYNGTSWTNIVGGVASELIIPTVTTGTGRIWMDRNLGASRIALSSTDTEAYGDYYQWGRPADGHQTQYLNNGFTFTKSSTSVPPNSLFIIPIDGSDDWLNTPDNTLWTGSNPANNPCPAGFRIPTEAEWAAEKATWSSNNSAGAFASPLKLPVPGWISNWHSNAFFTLKDAFGVYPTQTAYSNGQVKYLGIEPNNSWFDSNIFKYMGMPCRCIKD